MSPQFRFIEMPPQLERVSKAYEDDALDFDAQAELLRWQAQAPELLLLSRVGDAVLAVLQARTLLERIAFAEVVDATNPVVSIRPLPRILRRLRPALFPWRVVVATTEPKRLCNELALLRGWSGIGVDVVAGKRVHALGACRPGGGEGTVAGTLRDTRQRDLQLTCAHVVVRNCCSDVWRTNVQHLANGASDEPDAALLDPVTSCFSFPVASAREVSCATHKQLEEIVQTERPVSRIGGSHGGPQGRVRQAPDKLQSPGAVIAPTGLGGLARFPMVTLTRHRRRFRFNRRPFSREGDSGSWVVDGPQQLWIGMIVSGDPDMSLALHADSLTRYLAKHVPGTFNTNEMQCLTLGS
jgi:hypothetical protein